MNVLVLDTQLLVLLAVGATSRELIAKHKNTYQFDDVDFDLLDRLLAGRSLRLLPNTVTEASNLLRQHKAPERDRASATLKRLVEASREIYVPSSEACAHPEYTRPGLADAAVMLGTSTGCVLLTADAKLHWAAAARGISSVNFNHERERYKLV